MAISPPSDLVLDVVRAADPAAVQEAQARLKANRAAFTANSLADSGAGFSATVGAVSAQSASGLGNINNRAASPDIPATYKKFEAMVLQSFVKSMLPEESEEVYGKGTAGDVWKSMMAEQIGSVLAEGGGIGIAERLGSSGVTGADGAARVEASLNGNAQNLASGTVHEYQRKIVDTMLSDTSA